MSEVLVIGSLNMDMTLYVDRFPQIGETLPCQRMLTAPGGKGANQALAASRLGSSVRMAGCVGRDAYGSALIDELKRGGVDTALIRQLDNAPTGVAAITVCDGANMILINAGANAEITPEDIDAMEPEIAAASAIILQLEIPLPAVIRAAEVARRHGCLVALNPAPYRELPPKLLRLADYLIPNETETMAMLKWDHLDESNVGEALQNILALGVAYPVITLGDKGVAYLHEGRVCLDPSNKVDAVDTTAAGDTFIGGLITARLAGKPLPDAVSFAQRASAYCVAHAGAQPSIPTLEEVAHWYNKSGKAVPDDEEFFAGSRG